MKEYRVGSLVKFKRMRVGDPPWLGMIVEIRPDHHFRVVWCDDLTIIGIARCDDERFEVIL